MKKFQCNGVKLTRDRCRYKVLSSSEEEAYCKRHIKQYVVGTESDKLAIGEERSVPEASLKHMVDLAIETKRVGETIAFLNRPTNRDDSSRTTEAMSDAGSVWTIVRRQTIKPNKLGYVACALAVASLALNPTVIAYAYELAMFVCARVHEL